MNYILHLVLGPKTKNSPQS